MKGEEAHSDAPRRPGQGRRQRPARRRHPGHRPAGRRLARQARRDGPALVRHLEGADLRRRRRGQPGPRRPGLTESPAEPARLATRLTPPLSMAGGLRSRACRRVAPRLVDHVRAPDVLVEDRVALAGDPHVGVGGRLALLQQVALLDQAGDRGELLLVPAAGGLPAVQQLALGEHQPGRPRLHHLGQPRVPLRVGQPQRAPRGLAQRHPLHQQPAQLLVGQVGVGVHVVRRRPGSAPAARRPRSRAAPATGTPTPGGARRARSTCRRSGRRRSAAGARRAGPPRRCAPSAAGCCRCAGGTSGRSRAPCRPSRRCGRPGSP